MPIIGFERFAAPRRQPHSGDNAANTSRYKTSPKTTLRTALACQGIPGLRRLSFQFNRTGKAVLSHSLLGIALAGLILSPFTVLAQSPPWRYASASGAAAAGENGASTAQRLATFQKDLKRLRQKLDRSTFDPEELLDKLDYEPDKIVQFMQQNVAFEPYIGLLKGPQGTLMSRSGNSLDQVVLLAKLINDSGWQARIARTQLTEAQAQKLLQEMRQPQPPPPLLSDPAFRQSFQALLTDAGMTREQVTEAMAALSQRPDISQWPQFKDAQKNRDFLLNTLQKAGVSVQGQPLTPALAQQVKDYFWVEYRLDEGQPWISAQPVFSNPQKAFSTLKKSSVLADTVPQELLHRVRFSAYLERRVDKKLETERVFGPWEQATSHVYGQTLQYANVPDGVSSVSEQIKPEDIASKTRFLLPSFRVANNKPRLADRFFDVSGTLVDKMAAASQMAGVVQAVGNKADNAAGLLSGLGTPASDTADKAAQPAPKRLREITAQWLEVTLISPDGTEKTLRRYLLDRLGPEQRQNRHAQPKMPLDEADALWRLASVSQFIISPGRYDDGYIMDRYLQNLEELVPLLAKGRKDLNVQKLSEVIDSLHDHRPLQAAASLDAMNQGPIEGVSWRPHPAVLFLHNRYSLKQAKAQKSGQKTEQTSRPLQVQKVVDIAEYPDQVVMVTPLGIGSQPRQTALLGTWATRIEQDVDTVLDPATAVQFNVDKAFAEARKQGAGIQVLKDLASATSSPIWKKLPAESRAAIAQDLREGYAVVLPDKPVKNAVGWWRVHPKSGETLGRIHAGWGGEMTEYDYTVAAIGAGISGLLAFGAYKVCMNSGGCSQSGCLAGSALGFAIGLAFVAAGVLATLLGASVKVSAGIEIGARTFSTATLPGLPSVIPSCIEF